MAMKKKGKKRVAAGEGAAAGGENAGAVITKKSQKAKRKPHDKCFKRYMTGIPPVMYSRFVILKRLLK